MKIAVCSITHYSVHSPMQVGRHILDWQLQTDDRYFLSVVHDGQAPAEWDCNIDNFISGADYSKYQISYCQERRKCWGAWNRRDYLDSLDTEKYPYVWMMCADDMICPKAVEIILREFDNNPELMGVGFGASHHHYNYQNLPLGVYPSVNRADWINLVWRSDLAKQVGINYPEEYACDGLFHSEVFSAIQHDESKIKILPNILVFKN